MNDHTINGGLLESDEPEHSSLARRAKYLSIIYFIISAFFLGISFIPFLIKRVEGNDPHMVSGAHAGSMQLLFFVLIIIAALIVFLLGKSLLKFSSEIDSAIQESADSRLKQSMTALELFFTILGLFSLLAFATVIVSILNFI